MMRCLAPTRGRDKLEAAGLTAPRGSEYGRGGMKYFAPTSVEEAIAILASEPDAHCLAGGQTLVAMMNDERLKPAALVSLRRIAALAGIRVDGDGSVRIGALTTHAVLAAAEALRGAHSMLRLAAARVGSAAIRNAGTIGGALAHGDPGGDLPAATVAVDAEIETAGRQGARRVRAADFFVGHLTTALKPGEIVAAVRLPPAPRGARAVYEKFAPVDGGYPIVTVAAVAAFADGACRHARLVAGAVGAVPVRSEAAERRLLGTALDDEACAQAAALLGAAAHPLDDLRASASYRRKILPRIAIRALRRLSS